MKVLLDHIFRKYIVSDRNFHHRIRGNSFFSPIQSLAVKQTQFFLFLVEIHAYLFLGTTKM